MDSADLTVWAAHAPNYDYSNVDFYEENTVLDAEGDLAANTLLDYQHEDQAAVEEEARAEDRRGGVGGCASLSPAKSYQRHVLAHSLFGAPFFCKCLRSPLRAPVDDAYKAIQETRLRVQLPAGPA